MGFSVGRLYPVVLRELRRRTGSSFVLCSFVEIAVVRVGWITALPKRISLPELKKSMHAAAVLPANRGIGSGLGQQRPNGGRLSMKSTKARRRNSNSIHLMAASVATLLLLLTSIMYSYIKLSLQSHQDAHFSFGQNGLNNIPPSDNNNKRRSRPLILPGWKALPYGWGVKPQTILHSWNISLSDEKEINNDANNKQPRNIDPTQMLKAYLEPIDYTTWWHNKPLPVRATATAQQLTEISYPSVNSCRRLPEQWPTDEFPDADPFLPWIHDVFPTHDGKYIQFVAQNKRRCRTGTTEDDITTLQHMAPQVALFQHVPVKRLTSSSSSSTRRRHNNETRYRLAAHEEADPDGMATRFICRFKPLMKETLSVFNVDYDYAAYRKEYRKTFSEEGRDNKSVHTSQLIFQCPVPDELVEKIRTGSSVQDDWATIFVDIIPIRTPPRYGIPDQFFPPWYKSFETLKPEWKFDPRKEWGDDHILPAIEDSGRWENIPICKPSLLTYEPPPQQQRVIEEVADENVQKKHHLVACVWASAGYTTRGHRFAINDGQRRLLEWIQFHQLVGFDHFYVYDNSGAFSKDVSLQPITDLFPNLVTRISWPAKVCNNNPNNVDSPGERSSQYAAESSCRLRFGAHVNWIGSFDLDEYIVPVGKYNSLLPLLEKLDKQHKKIVSFGSWRSWPRREYIQ